PCGVWPRVQEPFQESPQSLRGFCLCPRVLSVAEVVEADSEVGQVREVAGLPEQSVEQQGDDRRRDGHEAQEQQLLTPPWPGDGHFLLPFARPPSCDLMEVTSVSAQSPSQRPHKLTFSLPEFHEHLRQPSFQPQREQEVGGNLQAGPTCVLSCGLGLRSPARRPREPAGPALGVRTREDKRPPGPLQIGLYSSRLHTIPLCLQTFHFGMTAQSSGTQCCRP
ncbi:unnamed protein product, partial [Gulo gulo]